VARKRFKVTFKVPKGTIVVEVKKSSIGQVDREVNRKMTNCAAFFHMGGRDIPKNYIHFSIEEIK
jgi:hypothetical protein